MRPASTISTKPFGCAARISQRRRRHLREGGLAAAVGRAVGLVVHVARVEQAEQAPRLREVEGLELRAIPDVGAARVPLLPLGGEVAAVACAGRVARAPRGRAARRQELRAAAAEHHLDAVAGAELDQLACDVGHAGGLRLVGRSASLSQSRSRCMRVAGGGRRVCDARRRDDAGREPARLRVLEQRRDAARCDRAGVPDAREVGETEHARLGLHARHHRRHRARGVGHLGVRVVGLREREKGQLLEGEQVLLAGRAGLLAGEDARGGHGRRVHAVADEQDHVLRAAATRREHARLGDGLVAGLEPGIGGAGGLGIRRRCGGRAAAQQRRRRGPRTSHPTRQPARSCSRPSRMRSTIAPRSARLVSAKARRGSSARRAASASASASSWSAGTTRSR